MCGMDTLRDFWRIYHDQAKFRVDLQRILAMGRYELEGCYSFNFTHSRDIIHSSEESLPAHRPRLTTLSNKAFAVLPV